MFVHEYDFINSELLDLIEGYLIFSSGVECGLTLHSYIILLSVVRGEEEKTQHVPE